MSTNVQATVVIDFNGGSLSTADYLAYVQLDPILNEEKTTFLPEETPVFMAHVSNNVVIDQVVALEGSIKDIGTGSRSEVFSNVFTSRNADELSTYSPPVVPSSSGISYKGRSGRVSSESGVGGILTYSGDISYTPFEALMDLSFPVSLYRLTPPEISLEEDETYSVTVVFYLRVI